MTNIRQIARSLFRDRGYSATVIMTLAVCVAANTATFAIVNSVLLRPLPVPNADRIVLMSNRYPKAGVGDSNMSGVADYYDRLEAVTALEQQALFRPADQTAEINGVPEQVAGMAVTPSLFPLVGVAAAHGRAFEPEEGEIGSEQKVILSDGLWRQLYGGDTAAIGRSLRLGGRPCTIVGVMPAGFTFVNPDVRLWIPLAFTPEVKAGRHSNNWHHIGLLKPGATINQVQAQIDALNAANLDRFPMFREILINAGFHTKVEPLKHLLVKDVAGALYLLWGGSVFVLLIGGLNLANLMLARSSARSGEIAARLALGASRAQLAGQLAVENGLLALSGGAAGVVLGAALLRGLHLFGLERFPRAAEVRVDSTAVLVSLALALAVTFLLGLAPLRQSLMVRLSSILHSQGGRTGTVGRRSRVVRQSLVATEVAIAFTLLAGAGLLLSSFRNLLRVDPGFTSEGVWTASTNAPRSRYRDNADLRSLMNRMLAELRSLPGVDAAGATSSIPYGGDYSDSVILAEGYVMKPGESLISPHQIRVTPGYFEAMNIALVRGRYFQEADNETAPWAVIVDERLARKFWPNSDPVGKRMYMPGDPKDLMKIGPNTRWLQVVGVVRAVRLTDLTGRGSPVGAYYFPLAQVSSRGFTLTIKTRGDAAALTQAVRSRMNSVDRELALFDIRVLSERMELSLSSRRAAMTLALGFGGIALFLAGIGIYGVLSYLVTRRKREIGIRMALGGTTAGVVRLVLREAFAMVLLGLVLGLAAATLLREVIQKEIYGVNPLEPAVILSVITLLALIAMVACLAPARRAAGVDPARVLNEY